MCEHGQPADKFPETEEPRSTRERGQPADKFPETEVPQCANMMRLPRQATRISFKLTTSYPHSLIATALLVFMIWDTSQVVAVGYIHRYRTTHISLTMVQLERSYGKHDY